MVGRCALCCSFHGDDPVIFCFVDMMEFSLTVVSNHTVAEMNYLGFQSIKY